MAAAPAMDVNDEGASGGVRNPSSMVVVKPEAACTNAAGPPVVDPKPVEDVGGGGDTTECSSSFGDTCSGFQHAAGDGEPEVNSGTFARADRGRPWKPPRIKVAAEWRNSVRPILWRCQWLELRMRELSSQVSKYDRELALNKKQKELQAASKTDGTFSESMQIHKGHENSIMKRRKRKRDEENLDTALYINKHQILSYYHDKQNKGAKTDGLLTDDDCGSAVPIRGGLDSVTLLDSEDYDVIFEQLSLKDILLTIDGVQSRVHLLQGRLRKAHYEGRNLAFSEGNIHVRVAQKREHTQNRSSYTEYRYTKPQKKKNLNVLFKDENGPALSGRPLPGRETDTHIKDANRIAEERSGECKRSREKAITVDLLLDISNCYIEENADDLLVDNQATSDVCQQFDKTKHLPSGTSSKEQNISAPLEVDTTCGPAEVDTTCALAVGQEISVEKSTSKEPVSSGSKQDPNSKKKKRKKGSLFTRKKQRKEVYKRPAAKEKTEGMLSAAIAKSKTESMSSAVAKQKTKGTRSAATGPQTNTSRSAGKKHKSVNEPAEAKEHGSGYSFLASMEQKTGMPSSSVKKQKTEMSYTAAKEKTEGTPSAANTQTESMPCAAAKQKTEGTPSAAIGPQTNTAHSAGKKFRSINEPAEAKEHGSGYSFSASMEQKTGKPSSSVKKQKSEISSTAAKEKTKGTPSATNTQTESMPSAAAKQKTEGTPSAATGPHTNTARSAGKKFRSINEPTEAKERGSGNSFSTSLEQKTGKPSSAVKKQKAEKSSTAAKDKTEGTLSAANTQTECTPSAAAKQKTEGTPSATTGLQSMTAHSAGKKRKSVNEPADAKEHESRMLFSASMEQKTGKPFSSVKKQKTEKSSTVAKVKTEGTPSAANTQTEFMPSAVAKPKTEGTPSAAAGLQTMTACSAGKKRKSVNEPADAKEHGSGNLISPSMAHKTWKLSPAVKKPRTGKSSTAAKKHGSCNSSSASMQQKTGKLSSAVKKQKSETSPIAAEKHGSGNLSSASKEIKTGKESSALKKQETESSSAAENKQEAGSASSVKTNQATENSYSKEKKAETASAPSKLQVEKVTENSSSKEKVETASAPSKPQVEKAVLVDVDSRRSQRVRKPKVFAE